MFDTFPKHGLIFVMADNFPKSEKIRKEFKRGLEEVPAPMHILCAHTGLSLQIAEKIGSLMGAPVTKKEFLAPECNPETAFGFVKECTAKYENGEFVFVIADANKIRYFGKHLQEAACYFLGNHQVYKLR